MVSDQWSVFWGALSRSLFLLGNLNRLGLNIVPSERIMAFPRVFPLTF